MYTTEELFLFQLEQLERMRSEIPPFAVTHKFCKKLAITPSEVA